MASTATPPQQSQPCPLYDLFLDLPHPAASKSCPGPFLIPPPVRNQVADEIDITRIAYFAFPEYDESSPTQQKPNAAGSSNLNQYDVYAMQNESFMQFTFSLQLQTGSRMHGHVRRYLPPHLTARTRYDVGRRGERALVLLTRATGADLLYTSILKTIEAISSQQAALSASGTALHEGNPQQWFLHTLSHYQLYLSKVYASRPTTECGKPLTAAISGLEFGVDHPVLRTKYKNFDVSRFIIPSSLLVRSPGNGGNTPPVQAAAGSVVPLLRCVGVAHAVRILSALLSERRVILVSSSPTRLAVCSHAAVSMLAIGLLHWQHLYIPVLPPHLWQYLAAPYPYLFGILTSTVPRLDRTDGLGEVLIIHLDTNQMETRGMESSTILQRLPDLFRTGIEQVQQQLPSGIMALSASEMLAQELFELLKQDKKVLYGELTLNTRVGETAAMATKAVKNTFFKLRDKGRQYLQQRTQVGVDEAPVSEVVDEEEAPEVNSMASDYIYTEGCHNESAEQQARIAFTAFFLSMFGDLRWYLSTSSAGAALDRNKFLQQKRAMGDGEGTPMWPLLNNFCQTQMLEEYAKARIEEVRTSAPITADMPLFLLCAAYCRQNNLDFGLSTCLRIARQVAEGSPAHFMLTDARRRAMALTSNKPFEGDNAQAIAQLVEESRECTSILFDVMSVIWFRLRDSRGGQWRHGYKALQILRNMLFHGPLAAISEATDGLSKIRAMKYYESIRSQSAQQIRTAAATVYNLLVDRAKLFHIRKMCTERRRVLASKTEPRLLREVNARIGVPFRTIHAMMHPNASHGTIAPISPKAPVNQTMVRGDTLPQQHTAPVPTAVDLLEQSVTVGQQGGSGAANDLVGLFDNVEIAQSSNSDANPFDLFSSVDISSSELPGNASTSFSASGSHEFTQAPQQRTPTVVNQNPNQVTQVLQQPPEQRQQPVYGVPPQQQQRPITPLQYASNSVSQGHQSARLLGPNGQPIAPQQFQQSPLLDVRQPQVPPGVQPGAPQYGAPRQVPGAFPQQHYQPGLSAQGGQKAHPQHQQQLQQHPQQQRQQHLHQQQQQQTQVHPRQLGVQPGYFPHHQAPPPGGYNPQQQLGQSVPPPPPYPSQLTPPPQHYQPYQSQPPQPSQQNNVSQFDPLAKK